MIIELLFQVVFSITRFLLSLIPDFVMDFQVPDLMFFSDMMGLANYFFPVRTLIAGISVIIFAQNFSFALKIFNWIYNKIPFI